MDNIVYSPVIEALKQVRALAAEPRDSEDAEQERWDALSRELALFTERAEIAAAEKRGKAIGIARGAAKFKEDALRCLVQSGMTEERARTILRM